jgi:hypothetical protein
MMSDLQALRELLFTPATFFRDRRIGLSLGAATVVAVGVTFVSTLGVGVLGWLLTQQMDAGFKVFQQIARVLPYVFVAGVLGWVLVAGGLHFVSSMFGGEGSFVYTLSVAGWAMVPILAQTAVTLTAGFLIIPGMEVTGSPDAVIRQFQQISNGGFTAAVPVATVLATLWQAYIWYGGMQVARGLDDMFSVVTAVSVGAFNLLASLVG